MLVLKRKEGQWVEVTHRSGDVMRIRVCKIEPGCPGHLNLAFDDDARNFEIERPERRHQATARAERAEAMVRDDPPPTAAPLGIIHYPGRPVIEMLDPAADEVDQFRADFDAAMGRGCPPTIAFAGAVRSGPIFDVAGAIPHFPTAPAHSPDTKP